MAFVIADRVRETSTTTGTGNFTLGGAVTGYQTFASALSSGDTTYYTIADQGGANWEVGVGTFTSPSTLSRDTILSSSNGGTAVTFTAGTKDVFISLPASRTVQSFSAGSTGFTPSTATYGAVTLAGTLAATNGGTGQTTYAVGDLLYASTTSALSKLADVATGNALISGGVGAAPSYGKIGLTTHVSGTLPVGNGGTGTATTFTTGSVVFAGASGVYSQDNSNLFWDSTNIRLGIATNSPTNKLDIVSAGSSQIRVKDGVTATAYYDFGRDGTDGFFGFSGAQTTFSGYKWSVNAGSEVMRITNGGNVGIGTSSPASKLDVNGAIRDSKGDVRTIVQNAQTAAYVLVVGDAGKHISITTGGVTVNSGIFSAGDAISIYNNSAANQTITQGTSVTMYLGGTATTGNRTLAQRGICTILCVAANTFVISGAGLT